MVFMIFLSALNYLITGQKYASSGRDHAISLGVYDHMKR
jgi:hypothetical protein